MIDPRHATPVIAKIRSGLGLGCALALLAACGPSKPTTDASTSDDNGDDAESSGVEGPDSGEASDTGPVEAMCTLEDYADDPGLLEFTEVGCFPLAADGTCDPCDLACAETIVTDCPIDGCGQPDFPCINECVNHTVLCSEQLGDQCCHLVTAEYSGAVPGRPLRERGVALLPSVIFDGPAGAPQQAAAADAYRELARYEQASVDAFLHAAAVLDQLGAPSELVADHREAAREEAEHARLALRAAETIDGRGARLGEVPRPSEAFELHAFVRDLIHDACINEAVAAVEAGWALAQPGVAEQAALRRFWSTVGADEAGHAALAWRTLEWLLATHPAIHATVQTELREATVFIVSGTRGCAPTPSLRSGPRSWETGSSPASPRDAARLERIGLASSDTKARLHAQVIDELLAEARLQRARA